MSSLVFLGSPPVAAGILRSLVDAGHDVRLVVTMPESRRGRRAEPTPTPVGEVAGELGLAVTDDLRAAGSAGAELGVVVAYGRIIGPELLEALLMVNVHFSILPRWRGAAPVERAILAGDEATGVSIMKVEAGLDTGGVYDTAKTAIGENETARELTRRLGEIGGALLLRLLEADLGDPQPQEGEPSYARKLTDGELHLDFARPAAELARLSRVGRAWTTWRGRRLVVASAHDEPPDGPSGAPGEIEGEKVATREGFYVPDRVRPEGRPEMAFSDWLRGARAERGERLGS